MFTTLGRIIMACGCKKSKNSEAIEAVVVNNTIETKEDKSKEQIAAEVKAVANAIDINLAQCYLCAKKHVGRARQFFEEYHNGYPDHVKNLVDTLFDAETEVYKAFQLWQKVQDQLDMGAGELLGNSYEGRTMKQDHVALAAEIRQERLKFDQNPLYIPKFDELKYKIHQLQHRTINEELKSNEQ
jgi:hypothetical protein